MHKVDNRIRIAELNGLTVSLQQAYDDVKNDFKDKFLAKQFNNLSIIAVEFNNAIKKTRLKSNLAEKDIVRDNKISALNMMLKGYLSFPEQEIKDAARYIYDIFKKYSVAINEKNYIEQSGYIMAMLTDFNDIKAQEAISKLASIDVAIANIKAAQDDFQNAHFQYEKSLAANAKKITATELKKPLIALINEKIISYLNTMEEEEDYEILINTIEQIIQDVNSKIGTRSDKEIEEEEELEESIEENL